MMENKIKVIAVAGPTASGKSALAIALAKAFDGEIVSCDSMQIYRKMDIGTAKATEAERKEVPHHLIDVADPDQCWSLAEFAKRAHSAIADIVARGKMPILCGGTGLYLDNILFDTELSEAPADEGYRKSLERYTNEELFEMLQKIDAPCAEANHQNNRRRVVRALEIYHTTGKTKTDWDRGSRVKTPRYDALIIGLFAEDRQILYDRIERRVDEMMEMGLAEEVARLAPELGATAAQAIGYKEILWGLSGQMTMEEAVAQLKTATRRYAKRQLTWFRANPDVRWIDITGKDKAALAKEGGELAKEFLKK